MGSTVEHKTLAGFCPWKVRRGHMAKYSIARGQSRPKRTENCEIAHIGAHGIVCAEGCENNSLAGNLIYDGRRRMEQ